MNRQQRRKLEREKKKKLICSFQSAKNVGWTESEFDNDVLNDDSISSEQIIAPYVCTPTTDKQEFEMTMREFGEAIQQSDTVIPPPRFEYIIIIKPHPYPTKEEMSSVVETIMNKYSPDNSYVVLTGTPPPNIDIVSFAACLLRFYFGQTPKSLVGVIS